MGVNPLTWAVGTGEDTGVVSTIIVVVMRASGPWRRCSRGKQLEKPVCAELELRNGLFAIRIVAKDITKGCKSTERGVREGSISKEEHEQKEYCG